MIKDDFVGPLDKAPWPTTLAARVVEPGDDVRVHGYALEADLAANYTFSETVLLALTGDLPSIEIGRAFDVALAFFARTTAKEGPIHAALLARICAASTSAIGGTGAITLGEQARFDLATYGVFLDGLNAGTEISPTFFASSTEASMTTARLRSALVARSAFLPEALAIDLEPTAALVAVFHACGIDSLAKLEALRVFARFPLVMAEALAAPPARYKEYPVGTPVVRYEEEVAS